LVREPISGLGVDTPNHFYFYSFEPSHEWTEFYSKRNELHQYFENCADKYDLHRDIRFETELVSLRYNEASASWDVSIRGKDGAEETLKSECRDHRGWKIEPTKASGYPRAGYVRGGRVSYRRVG
jgi:cation diffusion facilitator CzcD-associated flavoprotein CzcO